jgi:uncharacterized DUF497 family protein
MQIEFDAAKDASNFAKHGMSLAMAADLDWQSALIWSDSRSNYGETRQSALALLAGRVCFVAFVDRAEVRRIISLRKANNREASEYVNHA